MTWKRRQARELVLLKVTLSVSVSADRDHRQQCSCWPSRVPWVLQKVTGKTQRPGWGLVAELWHWARWRGWKCLLCFRRQKNDSSEWCKVTLLPSVSISVQRGISLQLRSTWGSWHRDLGPDYFAHDLMPLFFTVGVFPCSFPVTLLSVLDPPAQMALPVWSPIHFFPLLKGLGLEASIVHLGIAFVGRGLGSMKLPVVLSVRAWGRGGAFGPGGAGDHLCQGSPHVSGTWGIRVQVVLYLTISPPPTAIYLFL